MRMKREENSFNYGSFRRLERTRREISWAVRKKRTNSSALAALAEVAFFRCEDSDAGQNNKLVYQRRKFQTKVYQRRKLQLKVYTRRKSQPPCMQAIVAASIKPPENDGEGNCNYEDDDRQGTPPPVVKKSEDSAPKAWRGPRSARKIENRDAPLPPVWAGATGTEGGNINANEPEAAAAAATSMGRRPQRQGKVRVFKDNENTSTTRFSWHTHHPSAELGEIDSTTVSEGSTSHISESGYNRLLSLKLMSASGRFLRRR